MGVFSVNSYLLQCEATGEIVVVDPGDEPEQLIDRLEQLGVTPALILNTHGHLDHVAGNAAVKSRYRVPVRMHPDDQFLLDAFSAQAAAFGLRLTPPPRPDAPLVPGRPVRFGGCTLEVLHAPGHSPGHVILLDGAQAISGDVLFAGSIGRTDLPGGDLPTLLATLDDVVVPLGDHIAIHPGHGPATTVGQERASNPFLQASLRPAILREA